MIVSFILITLNCVSWVILWGEIRCWSPLGLILLSNIRFHSYKARENSLLRYLLYIHWSLFFCCLEVSTYDENDPMIYKPKFLSLILRGGSCLLYFPLNLCAENQRAGSQNWTPRTCPTFDRCVEFDSGLRSIPRDISFIRSCPRGTQTKLRNFSQASSRLRLVQIETKSDRIGFWYSSHWISNNEA